MLNYFIFPVESVESVFPLNHTVHNTHTHTPTHTNDELITANEKTFKLGLLMFQRRAAHTLA